MCLCVCLTRVSSCQSASSSVWLIVVVVYRLLIEPSSPHLGSTGEERVGRSINLVAVPTGPFTAFFSGGGRCIRILDTYPILYYTVVKSRGMGGDDMEMEWSGIRTGLAKAPKIERR